MFDAITYRLGRRRALKRVEERVVRPWNPNPSARRVLVVLPSGEEAAREGWRFVKSLGLPPQQVSPVVLPGEVTYVPAEYIRYVRRLEGDDVGRTGLPKAQFAEAVWGEHPDVAFCLTPVFDLAAAYLVGASPAQLRVGFFSEEADPFYDLMISPTSSDASALPALRETIARIKPVVLELKATGSTLAS